ncbi:hypothetical protein ACFL51_00345 [Myxococcota bacterium]
MNAEEIIEELMKGLAVELIQSDDMVTGLIAETNAGFFGLDWVDFLRVNEVEGGNIEFAVVLHLSGEQGEDIPFGGDSIEVQVEGVASQVDGSYRLSRYTVVDAERVFQDD